MDSLRRRLSIPQPLMTHPQSTKHLLRTSLLFRSQSTLRPSQTTPSLLSSPHRPFTITPHRPFSITAHRSARNANDKEEKSALLDREAVNTESNEYSKSGSDAGAASQQDPAFEPGKTDPDSELASSKPGSDGRDPLDVSPANTEISKPRDEKEGGPERGPERRKGSGKGGAQKNRKLG